MTRDDRARIAGFVSIMLWMQREGADEQSMAQFMIDWVSGKADSPESEPDSKEGSPS